MQLLLRPLFFALELLKFKHACSRTTTHLAQGMTKRV